MFWKCNSILQFNDRDCVQRVKKVKVDNFINGSRRPQLKIGLCDTKTELKQFIDVERMVLKKSNINMRKTIVRFIGQLAATYNYKPVS